MIKNICFLESMNKSSKKKIALTLLITFIFAWLFWFFMRKYVFYQGREIDTVKFLETFFKQALQINPNVSKIMGVICGVRVEEIEDKQYQQIRYLDKLIDELAKGKQPLAKYS